MDSFDYRRFVNLTLLVKRNPFQSIKEFYVEPSACVKDDSSSAFLQLKNSINSSLSQFDQMALT